jgi:hypothetical protein
MLVAELANLCSDLGEQVKNTRVRWRSGTDPPTLRFQASLTRV